MTIDPQFLRSYTNADLANNAFGKSFLSSMLNIKGLSQEAVIVILQATNRAPTSLFIEFANSDPLYRTCRSAADYQALLVAKNAVHFQCERIFETHTLQNIYSAVLTHTPTASFLEDTINLGIETELESFVNDILNVSFAGG